MYLNYIKKFDSSFTKNKIRFYYKDQSVNPSVTKMKLQVDSSSNRNEYQEYFLGVKVAGG
jgi:hypothetical protein